MPTTGKAVDDLLPRLAGRFDQGEVVACDADGLVLVWCGWHRELREGDVAILKECLAPPNQTP